MNKTGGLTEKVGPLALLSIGRQRSKREGRRKDKEKGYFMQREKEFKNIEKKVLTKSKAGANIHKLSTRVERTEEAKAETGACKERSKTKIKEI